MDQSHLSKLQPYCQELVFSEGHKLFTEGDSAEHLWIVVEGRVDLRFELPAGRATSVEHTVSSVEIDKKESVAQTFG
jgi:CRP-like cAMP-binding protein